MYTSRLLLDPNSIINKQKEDKERLYNAWNALAEGVGKKIGESFAEQNRKDYLANQKGVENLEDLPEWQDPQFRAAAYSFAKGDRSGIDNYYQTKALNQAREAEVQKAKEEQNRLNNAKYELAVQDIDTYKADPERKITAIKNAISVGDTAGIDTTSLKEQLKTEQNDLENSILATRAEEVEKEKRKIDEEEYEKEKTEVIAKLKDRIKKLPKNVTARNAEIEEITKIASMYGLTGLDIPNFATIKQYRTPAEEDEFQTLEARVRNNAAMSEKDIARYNYLKQFKYKGK